MSINQIKARKELRSFFCTIFWFTNAMNAIIVFLFLFSQEAIGLTVKSFFPAYGFFAFGAAAGSLVLSRQIDKRGPRTMLNMAGWLWIAVIAMLLAIAIYPGLAMSQQGARIQYQSFLIAGTLGGAALGLVWASSRPLLIELAPRNRLGEYFGFMELTSKFSGVIGPAVFGYLAAYAGYPWAISSLFAFFIIGLWHLNHTKLRLMR